MPETFLTDIDDEDLAEAKIFFNNNNIELDDLKTLITWHRVEYRTDSPLYEPIKNIFRKLNSSDSNYPEDISAIKKSITDCVHALEKRRSPREKQEIEDIRKDINHRISSLSNNMNDTNEYNTSRMFIDYKIKELEKKIKEHDSSNTNQPDEINKYLDNLRGLDEINFKIVEEKEYGIQKSREISRNMPTTNSSPTVGIPPGHIATPGPTTTANNPASSLAHHARVVMRPPTATFNGETSRTAQPMAATPVGTHMPIATNFGGIGGELPAQIIESQILPPTPPDNAIPKEVRDVFNSFPSNQRIGTCLHKGNTYTNEAFDVNNQRVEGAIRLVDNTYRASAAPPSAIATGTQVSPRPSINQQYLAEDKIREYFQNNPDLKFASTTAGRTFERTADGRILDTTGYKSDSLAMPEGHGTSYSGTSSTFFNPPNHPQSYSYPQGDSTLQHQPPLVPRRYNMSSTEPFQQFPQVPIQPPIISQQLPPGYSPQIPPAPVMSGYYGTPVQQPPAPATTSPLYPLQQPSGSGTQASPTVMSVQQQGVFSGKPVQYAQPQSFSYFQQQTPTKTSPGALDIYQQIRGSHAGALTADTGKPQPGPSRYAGRQPPTNTF